MPPVQTPHGAAAKPPNHGEKSFPKLSYVSHGDPESPVRAGEGAGHSIRHRDADADASLGLVELDPQTERLEGCPLGLVRRLAQEHGLIEVHIVAIRGDRIKVGFIAPPDVPIFRKEISVPGQQSLAAA